MKCSTCRGKGEVICPHCAGAGEYTKWEPWTTHIDREAKEIILSTVGLENRVHKANTLAGSSSYAAYMIKKLTTDPEIHRLVDNITKNSSLSGEVLNSLFILK